MTIHEALSAVLSQRSQNQAIFEYTPDVGPRVISFSQLGDEVVGLSQEFTGWGIGKRHKVAFFLENSIEFIESFLAILAIRAVPVIVQLDFRKLELEEIFSNAQPEAVISEDFHLDILRPYLGNRLVIGRRNHRFYRIQNGSDRSTCAEFPEETASINYTYRGYGYPLGALAPHAQYLNGANCFQKCVQFQRGGSLLSILPFSHMFSLVGCILLSLLFGIRIIISRSLSPRSIFNIIREQRINYLISVPDILLMLSRSIDPEMSFPSLQTMVSGGSLLRLEDQLCIEQAFGAELLNGYGLTEFTPITGNVRGQSKKGTIGCPSASLEVRIESENTGRIGEICLRTEDMARSYYRRAKETSEAVRDSWFLTGDLGYFDDSHLVFAREKKETRKVHGNMVDLNEVRRAIALIDPTLEVKVDCIDGLLLARLGIPSTVVFEQKVAEIRRNLRQSIASYKIPGKFYRLDECPPGGSTTCP